MRGALGLTSYTDRRIFLSYGDARHHHRVLGPLTNKGPVETLLHEFVHVRCPRLRHGAEFLALENALRARAGFAPAPTWYCA